jgi:uncharacterized protein YigA (DUF484 family)
MHMYPTTLRVMRYARHSLRSRLAPLTIITKQTKKVHSRLFRANLTTLRVMHMYPTTLRVMRYARHSLRSRLAPLTIITKQPQKVHSLRSRLFRASRLALRAARCALRAARCALRAARCALRART